MSHPFHLANLVVPALDGIVRALSWREGQTEAGRLVKADTAVMTTLAFQPRDVVELTLSGQIMLFNELLADGARDVLRGTVDTEKQRCRSSLVSMGRLVLRHVDRLERRGNQPYRTGAAVSRPAEVTTDAAEAMPVTTEARGSVDLGGGRPGGQLVVETSWLDDPYEQWVIARIVPPTDASAAARGSRALTMVPRDVEPALPRRLAGYSPVLTLAGAPARE
jgi:hypothetical protein